MQLRPLPFFAGPIFALIFWGAFTSWILPEIIAWRVKRSTDFSKVRDQGSLSLIVILWWAGIAMGFSLSLLLPQAAISWERTAIFSVGICLMLTGIALRWYSAALSCLGFAYAYRIPIEEAALASALGETYTQYAKRTWRLVPFLF